jgi:hypothetical protein
MTRRIRTPLARMLVGLALLLPLTAPLVAPAVPSAAAAPLAPANHLVISQFVVKTRVPYATFGSPFVAITNPTAVDLDLSHVYLTDATLMPSTLYSNLALNSPATAPPGGGSGGDFHAKFPDGYVLPAGATVAVALAGSTQYQAAYGRLPDFELYEDEYYVPDTVSELVAAFPGAVNGVGLGGGTNVPALSDVSESLVLYSWDGHSDLVQDLDYVMWGSSTTVRVDKSGRTVGASTYLNDTPVALQTPAAAAGPTFGHALRRLAGFDEGTETATGGNGIGGHDETSENLSANWADVVGSTPPPAPAVRFPAAPIFTAASHAPETPWVGLAVPLTAKVFSNSALTAVTFHYNVDGGAYADSVGVYMGNNTWTAIVPPQAGNAVVTWYCSATNAAGRTETVPVAAPRYTKGWTVATAPPVNVLRKPPYLVWLGDPTTMQVLWQTATSWPCSIQWGTDTNYTLGTEPTSEFGSDHQHQYTLTGLVPGQKYYYRVIFDQTTYTGSFLAAPPAGTSRLKFIAYGDTRTNSSVHDAVVGQMMHSIDVDPERQTLIVSVGDMVTDGDSETSWDNEYFAAVYGNVRRMNANVPFQACMGNHEGTGTLFQKYFPYPQVAGRYWSFDYGPAHFAYVDQYVDYAPGTAQYEWLRNDLMTSTKPWRFVVLHEPGWSAAGGHDNNLAVQAWLQPLFEQYGVSIVFCGHNHYYARAEVNGVKHITTGGGGGPLHTPEPFQPNVVVAVSTNQYSRITIDGSRLGFAAVNGTTVLDTFIIDKVAAVETAPASALQLAATPNPFNPVTTLRYTLPSAGLARLAVYDLAGRRVRTLVDGSLPSGQGESTWDGRDDGGRGLASGTYFARLEAAETSRTVRLSLVR